MGGSRREGSRRGGEGGQGLLFKEVGKQKQRKKDSKGQQTGQMEEKKKEGIKR